MSLLVFVVVAFGFAGLALAVRRAASGRHGGRAARAGRRRVVAAVAIEPGQVVRDRRGGLATTGVRAAVPRCSARWSGWGSRSPGSAARHAPRRAGGHARRSSARAALTLGLVDAAGGRPGRRRPAACSACWSRSSRRRARRARRSASARRGRSIVAGALAIAATAWFGRDLSQLAAQPVVFGLGLPGLRGRGRDPLRGDPVPPLGRPPADVVPETALPILTALAPGRVRHRRARLDRRLGGAAARRPRRRRALIVLAIAVAVDRPGRRWPRFVQDDLEHVLGYSIVGDAGVIVLALAVARSGGLGSRPGPGSWPSSSPAAPSRHGRPAIRAGFCTGRVADLRGWARRSPVLAVALVRVAHRRRRVPGAAAFDARASIVDLSLDGRVARRRPASRRSLPLVYYGRLLAIGLSRPDREAEPVDAWRPRLTRPDVDRGPTVAARRPWDANRGFTTRPHRGAARSPGAGHRRPARSMGRRSRRHHRRTCRRRARSIEPRASGEVPGPSRSPSGRPSPSPGEGPGVRGVPSFVRGEHPAIDVALVLEQLGGIEPQRELGRGGLRRCPRHGRCSARSRARSRRGSCPARPRAGESRR